MKVQERYLKSLSEKFRLYFSIQAQRKLFVQIPFVSDKQDEADLRCVSSEHLFIRGLKRNLAAQVDV